MRFAFRHMFVSIINQKSKTMQNKIKFLISILIVALFASCEMHEMDEPGLLVPLTVEEDPSLPSIVVNGTELHAETFGNPTDSIIIVIHGGPGADYRGLLNCSELANDGYYVVFYDQRGCGLSKRHDADTYTTQLYLDDLDAVIEHYKQSENQKVILFGHSWGGMMAAGYIDQHPEKVRGVIIVEAGGFTWDQTEEYISRSQQLNIFNEQTNDYVYLDQFITSDEHNTLDYKMAINATTDIGEDSEIGNTELAPFWRFGAACFIGSHSYVVDHPFDFTQNLGDYNTKVLFAYSELNNAYGLSHAEEVSSAFPNVELIKVMGAGHEAIYFGWESLYPAVQSYLNELNQ